MQLTAFPSSSPSHPGRKDDGTPGERPVLLVAGGQDQARLGDILKQVKCRPCLDVDAALADQDQPPAAAVVSDGIEAPLALCARLARHCPVVLVSDETEFAFRLAAVRAGVAAIVRRPVNPTEMSEWLSFFAAEVDAAPFSVLIVDDDWLTAEVNAEVLRSVGIKVKTVQDPRLALQCIEDGPPDLVLMDVQMPGIDGVELTRLIRQSRHLLSLPVIFLSAERDEARQFAARTLGGDDFIMKPVVPEKLIRLVRLRADRSRLLRSMIERDRLTGLYDQTIFTERLSHELERCRRTKGRLSLATVDIDFFKRVNDTYGHLMGDHVLRVLASALLAGLRQIDVVGRCGGEEFGIVLLDTSPEDAALAVDRIREDFSKLVFRAGDETFSVSFSAGVACSRDSDDRLADLVSAADQTLYRAKREGRDRVCVAGTDAAVPPRLIRTPHLSSDGAAHAAA